MSSPPSPLARERAVAEAAARAAGALIRQHAGRLAEGTVRDKGPHDPVTLVDEAAQRVILAHLHGAFPADAVLAEEEGGIGVLPGEGRCWIVDPLDGTTNFIHGVPPYAVSIGLQDGPELVVGVVYDVTHDELFVAARGEGLTLNGRPARVSATATLDAALVATGFPFRDYRYVEGYLAAFERVIRRTRGVRRHGSAAVDLAWVACGRFDGFFEAGLSPWDAAAGVVLVREGGGCVTGLTPGADPVLSGGVVASNGRLQAALQAAAEPLGAAYAGLGEQAERPRYQTRV